MGEFSIRGNTINLEAFTNGIGISSLDLNELQFIPCDKVSKIITIENLTSFNRFNAEEAIIIYLGGYSLNNSPNNFNLLFNQHKS